MEYKFGIGMIDEVLKGAVRKENSLEKLKRKDKSSIIIVPSLIGVYQNHKARDEGLEQLAHELEGLIDGLINGFENESDPDLICIAYDPTLTNKEVLEEVLRKKDSFKRLKLTEYYELERVIDDFYEKEKPKDINPFQFLGDDSQIPLLEKLEETYTALRRDFGLTREEAINHYCIKKLLSLAKKDNTSVL